MLQTSNQIYENSTKVEGVREFDCPTCEGTGFVMRDPQTWSPTQCPTCTPESEKPLTGA